LEELEQNKENYNGKSTLKEALTLAKNRLSHRIAAAKKHQLAKLREEYFAALRVSNAPGASTTDIDTTAPTPLLDDLEDDDDSEGHNDDHSRLLGLGQLFNGDGTDFMELCSKVLSLRTQSFLEKCSKEDSANDEDDDSDFIDAETYDEDEEDRADCGLQDIEIYTDETISKLN